MPTTLKSLGSLQALFLSNGSPCIVVLNGEPFYKTQELEDEKSFKDRQLKSSEMTMRRLQQDKEKREQEMEKINTLDEKVANYSYDGIFPCVFFICCGQRGEKGIASAS